MPDSWSCVTDAPQNVLRCDALGREDRNTPHVLLRTVAAGEQDVLVGASDRLDGFPVERVKQEDGIQWQPAGPAGQA